MQVADVPAAPGANIRSANGRARASYHPEWSEQQPWVTYIDGTAGLHFPTMDRAVAYLTHRGHRFAKNARPS